MMREGTMNERKHQQRFWFVAVSCVALIAIGATPAAAIPWPYQPFNQTHGLGNHYNEYQNYGGSPYFHDGIDLVTPTGPTQTYSVAAATVTHLTYNDPMYSGIMIGQPVSGGEGWLYWHINSTTFQYDIGDPVPLNAYIGTTAYWTVSSFHHTHFNKVVGTGGYPWTWYTSTDNPLLYLEPRTDPDRPVFETTYSGQKFAFRRNQATTMLDPTALSGDVDIISRIYDIVGLPQWKLNPWRIDSRIAGATQSVPLTNSLLCSGLKPNDSYVSVVYSTQSPLVTMGNYDLRIYYFILTNTDGDGVIESTDASLSWQTGSYRPGDYWVYVTATDIGGNATTDSMMCTIAGTVNVAVNVPETSHDFGMVPMMQTATWGMHVQNSGSDWLSVRDIASNNPVFRANPVHLFVPPGGDAVVTVQFSPSAPQTYSGTLTITTNDPVTPQVIVRLNGRGLSPADAGDVSASGRFGIIGTRPLNGGAEIRFGLEEAGSAAIEVYDVSGRVLRRAALRDARAGGQSWTWDGRDEFGRAMTNGVYYVRLRCGLRAASGSCVLVH
jgi:hypothetical protein